MRREEYVPLSVRHGSRWRKLTWRVKGWREAVALRLAPWLGGLAIQQETLDAMGAIGREVYGDTPWTSNYTLGQEVIRRLRTAKQIEAERADWKRWCMAREAELIDVTLPEPIAGVPPTKVTASSEALSWIRSAYKVPANVGVRVIVAGKRGRITGGAGPHLVVKGDDGVTFRAHPTWEVQYLDAETVT